MTKKTTTGIVAAVELAGASQSGNLTYRITLDDGRTFLTLTDGQVGYAATNYRPSSDQAPREVVLTLDGRDRVTGISYADEAR